MPESTEITEQGVRMQLGLMHAGAAGRRPRWILGVAAVVLTLCAFLARHLWLQRGLADGPHYVFAKVQRGDLQVSVSATGTLKGRSLVEVGAEVSGRVLEVLVDYNDRVVRGQLLATLDPERMQASVRESLARLQESQAAVHQSSATLREAQQNHARAVQQAASELLSKQELEASEAALERAKASFESARATATVARASLESQRSQLDKTRILSPIDGVVLSRSVEPGQTITAGFTTPLLFKLTEDLREMELVVSIDESDVGRTRAGQVASFTVDAYPGRQFPSKVLSVRNEAKEQGSVVTYDGVLAVDNADLALRPGMTATATIIAEVRRNVLHVPNAALRYTPPQTQPGDVTRPGERRLWLHDPAKRYPLQAVSVKTGATDGTNTELLEGLVGENAKVVTDALLSSSVPPGGRT